MVQIHSPRPLFCFSFIPAGVIAWHRGQRSHLHARAGSAAQAARQREQRGSVELVRSSNECIGDFESTEEALCCPDFRVTT
jgi:hypothetical protein